MIKCPDCKKFGACDKASEDVIECLDFKKQSYEVEVERKEKNEERRSEFFSRTNRMFKRNNAR